MPVKTIILEETNTIIHSCGDIVVKMNILNSIIYAMDYGRTHKNVNMIINIENNLINKVSSIEIFQLIHFINQNKKRLNSSMKFALVAPRNYMTVPLTAFSECLMRLPVQFQFFNSLDQAKEWVNPN